LPWCRRAVDASEVGAAASPVEPITAAGTEPARHVVTEFGPAGPTGDLGRSGAIWGCMLQKYATIGADWKRYAIKLKIDAKYERYLFVLIE
jgi:hypothetical protein